MNRRVLFLIVSGLISGIQAQPKIASAEGRMVQSIKPAPLAVRQTWVAQETERWVESYDGTPTNALIELKREELMALAPGTQLFELPGVFIHDGSNVFVADSATVIQNTNGYDVYRNGKPLRRFPASAKITHVPALFVYYGKPGQLLSNFLSSRRPSTIAP